MKRIGLLFLLFSFLGGIARAQNEKPEVVADSQGKFRRMAVPLEVKISCEGQKHLITWDLSLLDSTLLPSHLLLRGYRYEDTDRIFYTDRLLDSTALYEEGELWLSVPGHYFLEGVDSSDKIAYSSAEVVLEVCAIFQLPSTFTLGEGKYYRPSFNQNIERIELVIFDSQGLEVFSTRDPDFRWDGRNAIDGELCKPGTYFYNCDVYELKGQKTVKRNMTGMIELGY